MSDDVKALKKKLAGRSPAANAPDYAAGLSTGLTLLNLALTGRAKVGFTQGSYCLLVGGSRSGKTFICGTALAEATLNKVFKDHRLIYNDPERGARMDVKRFFGAELARRLEWRHPRTVEEFYYALDDDKHKGPFVQVLDSMDALEAEDDAAHFTRKKKAASGDGKAKGSYGTAKAKANSSGIRHAVLDLAETGSILLVISQTRMNIGFGAMFNPETRSGGTALQFYATNEVWFKRVGSIKRTVHKKARTIGTVVKASVKKNRDTGREWPVELHHYPSVGFDDVGSLIAYLVAEGRWTESKGKITAPEFDLAGPAEQLAQEIQEAGLEPRLRLMAAGVWKEIEAACAVKRKPRYQ